jgi:capsular exopolysaccharide synthesis family protein
MINFKFGKSNEVLPGPDALVAVLDPRSQAAEAYRSLRTNIQFSAIEKPVRTLLVTSARPGEDKSVVAANLAVAFAQSGSKTILLDADLRRPVQHLIFRVPNDQGLTSTLLNATGSNGNGTPKAVSLPLRGTNVENLHVLTAGPLPPNPAELLGSQILRELVDQLRNEADYVVIDAPPVLVASDAAVLAARVDGVLLALKSGKTGRDDAREAKEQLEKVHANILGAVLGNVRQPRASYGY